MPIADLTPYLENDGQEVIEKTIAEVTEIIGQLIPQGAGHLGFMELCAACHEAGYEEPYPIFTHRPVVFNRMALNPAQPPVWKLVRKAVIALLGDNGGQISFQQIKDYILTLYEDVNPDTVDRQIRRCSVNSQARTGFHPNKKARITDGEYDFLYIPENMQVQWYNPAVHGQWEIIRVNGEPQVRLIGENVPNVNPVNNHAELPDDVPHNQPNGATLNIDTAIEAITRYHQTPVNGGFTRFRSWEHCHKVFRENRNHPNRDSEANVDYLSLHLAWYLASWGMLRNQFLLSMDYRVHLPIVRIILSGQYDALFTDEHTQFTSEYILEAIQLTMQMSNEIENVYSQEYQENISDTLMTKILLGVFGCAPAYDRFFKYTAHTYNICGGTWNEDSLMEVWHYYQDHQQHFEDLRHELAQGEGGILYPPMKLMDMCLWQIGIDEEIVI